MIFCIALLSCQTLASISGHISVNDQEKLKGLVDKILESSTKDDLATIYYYSKTYELLKNSVPETKVKQTCGHLTNAWSKSSSIEQTFYITASWKNLACPGKIFTKEMIEVIILFFNYSYKQ